MDEPDDGDELGHLQGHAGQHRGVRCVQPAVHEYHFFGGLLISNKERWPIPRNFRRVAIFVPFVQAVG